MKPLYADGGRERESYPNPDVTAPWDKDLDVTEMGDSDFERGSVPLTINVSDGYHFRLLAALAETWGYAPDKTADALDRAIRLYLTYCLDSDDTFEGWRVDHDTVTTFPDHGDDLDALRVDVDPLSIDTSDRRNYGCGITPTMDTLLTKLIDEGYAANRSDFVRDAIEYAAHADG